MVKTQSSSSTEPWGGLGGGGVRFSRGRKGDREDKLTFRFLSAENFS